MLEQFRDVMVIILAFMGIGATILFITLTVIIFRKVSHTVDSAKGVVSDIRGVSSLVSKGVVKPTLKGISLVTGVGKVFSTISKLTQKKEGKGGKGK